MQISRRHVSSPGLQSDPSTGELIERLGCIFCGSACDTAAFGFDALWDHHNQWRLGLHLEGGFKGCHTATWQPIVVAEQGLLRRGMKAKQDHLHKVCRSGQLCGYAVCEGSDAA